MNGAVSQDVSGTAALSIKTGLYNQTDLAGKANYATILQPAVPMALSCSIQASVAPECKDLDAFRVRVA